MHGDMNVKKEPLPVEYASVKSPCEQFFFRYFGFPVSVPFHTYLFDYQWRHINLPIESFVKWNTALSARRTLLCGVRPPHLR